MFHRALIPLSVLTGPALAQAPAAQSAQDIIVTGRGLETGIGESVYDSVTIDHDRLIGSASGELDQILKDVPGFQLFRRSDARSANPTSQGATLRALGGNASSRALLVLDGVPQTDPFGGWVSWPAYDPERLGAARVTRGGGSGAQGPGALAGTIELFSATPAEAEGFRGAVAYGSRDGVDAHAGLGLAAGAGFFTVSGSYARGDGFVPIVSSQRGPVDRASPYDQASVALRLVEPVAAGVELQASGLWFSDDRQRGTAFSGISTQGTDASLRLVGPNWSALGYVQTRDFYNSFASVDAARAHVMRASEQYDVPSTGIGARAELRPHIGGGFELRLGGDWRETIGETDERYSFVNGAGTRGRMAGGLTDTLGGFAEGAWEHGPLTLTAGGRIDRWWIRNGFLDERVFATGQSLSDVDYPDRAGWEPTARAGFAIRPAKNVTLRGAAYLGWRLPTLNELYRPFRIGADTTQANAALAPERLKGVEAGLDWRPFPAARIGATIFANRLDDAIGNVTIGQSNGGRLSQRQNLDAIVSRGLEVDASVTRGDWTLSGGYSHVAARVRADGPAIALDGLRPAQTPRDTFSSTLAWQSSDGLRASATARYVGGQYEDDLNTQLLRRALTFDAAAALSLTGRLGVEVRAENLTNRLVEAGISGDGLIERATPRTLWIGLRVGR